MPLINCEINLILTGSSKCVLSNSVNQESKKLDDSNRFM